MLQAGWHGPHGARMVRDAFAALVYDGRQIGRINMQKHTHTHVGITICVRHAGRGLSLPQSRGRIKTVLGARREGHKKPPACA